MERVNLVEAVNFLHNRNDVKNIWTLKNEDFEAFLVLKRLKGSSEKMIELYRYTREHYLKEKKLKE